jgi:hypothetical protein
MFRISRIAEGSGSRQASSGWWSQRDLNPCLKMTTTSPFIFESLDDFNQVRNGYDLNMHVFMKHLTSSCRGS